jgi:putative nucleotidyltransferase with HDIG domain
MNKTSTGVNATADRVGDGLSVVDQVLAPRSRARFLHLMGLRLSIRGMDTIGKTAVAAGDDGEDTRCGILSGIAEAINEHLGVGETVVVLFRDAETRRWVAGSSHGAHPDGTDSILTGIAKRIDKGFSPISGRCMRIDRETGEYVGGVFDKPGTVLVSPVFVRDRVAGLIGTSGGEGEHSDAGQEARLMLTTVLMGRVVEETAGTDETEERLGSLAHALSDALDARTSRGKGHSYRVAMYSMAIFNEMDHDENDPGYQGLRHRVRLAALLHDVGKITIPESIIRKDDLSDEDREFIKRHPAAGAEILTACHGLGDLVPGVLYHHEHFDGSGYPFSLTGCNIPLSARIIAAADAFDTMTTGGCVGKGVSHEEAIGIIRGELADDFDPAVLYALGRAHENGTLRHVRLASGSTESQAVSDADIEAVYGGQLKSIPSLPHVLAAVNSLLDDPDTSLKEVAGVLSTDQGLAARVLKLVNSSYYGLPGRVSTIALAATMLGARVLKNHVVNLAYADLMNGLAHGRQGYDLLWKHALKTAVWAKTISSRGTDVDPEEAFTAGLLHDIGKMLCLRLRPEEYGRALLEAEKYGGALIGLEEDVIGFDHMRMGAWAASHWKLPEVLVSSIRRHHDPDGLDEHCESIYYVVRVVHLADIAAKGTEKEGSGFSDFMLRQLSPRILRELGRGYLSELAGIRAEVKQAESALEEAFAGFGADVS